MILRFIAYIVYSQQIHYHLKRANNMLDSVAGKWLKLLIIVSDCPL